MKNRKIFLIALIALFGVFSCEDVEPEVFTGEQFISLDPLQSVDFSIGESDDTQTFTITMSQLRTEDTSIELEIEDMNTEAGADYMVSSTSLVIPAGEYSTSFDFTPIDNSFFDQDMDGEPLERIVSVSIVSNSAGFLNGLSNANSFSRNLILIDDDCPIDIESFVGVYTVDENFTDGVNAPNGLGDFFNENYQVEIALDPSDNTGTKVILTNSAGFNIYLGPDDNSGLTMTFLACSGEVIFDAGPPLLALFRNFEFDASSYDEGINEISCTGPLATFGPYQFTLTKQ